MLSLLGPEDYEALPDDPKAKWISLERTARQRLEIVLDDEGSTAVQRKLTTLQYLKTISAAAASTGVDGIKMPAGSDPAAALNNFITDVEAAVAGILLGERFPANQFGLKIGDQTKANIRRLIVEVQSEITNLSLKAEDENRLQEALLAFLKELDAPRSRFAIGSAHLLIALTVLNLSVTTVAAGGDAIDNIQRVQVAWGQEKHRAEAETLGVTYVEPMALLESPRPQIEGAKDKK